jgi:hypothetical protein
MVDPPEPGIRLCVKCRFLFVSPDPERLRRCRECLAEEDTYEPPAGRVQVDGGVRSLLPRDELL